MNPTKAIETLTYARDECIEQDAPNLKSALTLGIEALERHQQRCGLFPHEMRLMLPSETKE